MYETLFEQLERAPMFPRAPQPRPLDLQAEILRGHLADLHAPLPVFMVGDLVRQKRGLAMYQEPRPGTLGIVVALLPSGSTDAGNPGTPHWLRPLHFRVGAVTPAGDFIDFAVDARCFELVPPADLAPPAPAAADAA